MLMNYITAQSVCNYRQLNSIPRHAVDLRYFPKVSGTKNRKQYTRAMTTAFIAYKVCDQSVV